MKSLLSWFVNIVVANKTTIAAVIISFSIAIPTTLYVRERNINNVSKEQVIEQTQDGHDIELEENIQKATSTPNEPALDSNPTTPRSVPAPVLGSQESKPATSIPEAEPDCRDKPIAYETLIVGGRYLDYSMGILGRKTVCTYSDGSTETDVWVEPIDEVYYINKTTNSYSLADPICQDYPALYDACLDIVWTEPRQNN